MGLFDEEDLPNTKRQDNIPVVQEFETARVNTEDQPVGTLLTHIGGMRWVPKYVLTKVMGGDEEVGSYQGKLRPINRQYRKINDMEIKVQTPAPNNPQVDNQNQEITVRGTARVYPNSFIPNPGDMIVGETADGRMAVYQICDTVTPLSMFKRTAYEFDYVMYAWWSQHLENEMLKGVVAEYYFIRDNIDSGINPLIAKQDYGIWQELNRIEQHFPQAFVNRYLSREYNTFLIPGQQTTIYDPFHSSFCNMLFRPNAGIFGGANLIPVEDASNATRVTVHSALLQLNPFIMQDVMPIIPIISAKEFLAEPYTGGIRFAGTNFVVYPPEDNALLFSTRAPVSYGGLTLTKGIHAPVKARVRLADAFPDEFLGDALNPEPKFSDNTHHSVADDDFYIFSEAFYGRDETDMSLIEAMMWKTLEQNMVDPKDLIMLFKASQQWSVLDQFYLQPFLYAMIPAAYRGV